VKGSALAQDKAKELVLTQLANMRFSHIEVVEVVERQLHKATKVVFSNDLEGTLPSHAGLRAVYVITLRLVLPSILTTVEHCQESHPSNQHPQPRRLRHELDPQNPNRSQVAVPGHFTVGELPLRELRRDQLKRS
jgi:hypothetical protein